MARRRFTISSPTSCRLLSGELNFGQVNEQDKRRLDESGLRNLEFPVAGTWLAFNQLRDRPLADKRVREALIRALDTAEVVKVSTAGTGSVPTGLVVLPPRPCPENTVDGQLPGYDTAAAERLLDEAGWAKGADGVRAKDGKRLTLSLPYAPTYAALDAPTAEYLAEQWRAIGIDVQLNLVTPARPSNCCSRPATGTSTSAASTSACPTRWWHSCPARSLRQATTSPGSRTRRTTKPPPKR